MPHRPTLGKRCTRVPVFMQVPERLCGTHSATAVTSMATLALLQHPKTSPELMSDCGCATPRKGWTPWRSRPGPHAGSLADGTSLLSCMCDHHARAVSSSSLTPASARVSICTNLWSSGRIYDLGMHQFVLRDCLAHPCDSIFLPLRSSG